MVLTGALFQNFLSEEGQQFISTFHQNKHYLTDLSTDLAFDIFMFLIVIDPRDHMLNPKGFQLRADTL